MPSEPSPFSITGDLTPPFDATESTALYRMYDSTERLLYIGISDNPLRRWSRHAATKVWWPQVHRCDLTWYLSRVEALGAEKSAIREEHPRYNDVHSASVSAQEAEALLQDWADNNARRDALFRAANRAGVSKNRIHAITGVARTTIDRILAKEPTMTAQDLAYAVSLTLGDHIEDYDIDAIVADIFERYGRDIPNIDAVPTDEYWEIVQRHDTSEPSDTVTLYETNSDLLVLARGNNAWTLHLAGDHMLGMFAADAKAWIEGDWEPNTGDGQTPTDLNDLNEVATWSAADGLKLLVRADSLGGAARDYLGSEVTATDD